MIAPEKSIEESVPICLSLGIGRNSGVRWFGSPGRPNEDSRHSAQEAE